MPQAYLPLKELSELSGIDYEAIKKANQRGSLKSYEENGMIQVNIDSFLRFYPDVRSTFLKNWREIKGNRYKASSVKERSHRSTLDPNKVMTEKTIEAEVLADFLAAVTTVDKIAACQKWQTEFPDMGGISYKSIYRKAMKRRIHGQEAGERKVRADQGKPRIDQFAWCYEQFEKTFLKYFMSHVGDDINRYAGGNVSKSYRLAIMEIMRSHGYPLPDLKDCYAMRKEAEKALDQKYPGEGRKLPTEAKAFEIARRPVHIAARKFRLHKGRHHMETLPIHKYDYWRQKEFMESVHSDWHTLHEKYMIEMPDGKIKEKYYHIIFWVEAKTGYILHWSRQAVGSPSGDRTILSFKDVVKKCGRPESVRFDNGMEYINARNTNTILSLYTVQECNERQRIERAQAYKGWQKIVERINEQIENYMKLSDGYSGSNREVAAHPELGTRPIKAVRTLAEMDEIVESVVKAYNHEYIEVDMKYANGMRDIDLIYPGSEGPRLSKNKKTLARRIDLYNAFRMRFTQITYEDDYLTMIFGLPEVMTVKNTGVWKTWCGERYLYIPHHSEITKLADYNGAKVIIKYDPSSEYSLQKMHVFEAIKDAKNNQNLQAGAYITTVYCDLLNGFTREQAEEYRKAKQKINAMLKALNTEYVFAKALDRALEMQLEKETEVTTKTAGKVIVWNQDVSRFADNRDREAEAIHEMMDIRREISENQSSDWEFDEDLQMHVNKHTGEIKDIPPQFN